VEFGKTAPVAREWRELADTLTRALAISASAAATAAQGAEDALGALQRRRLQLLLELAEVLAGRLADPRAAVEALRRFQSETPQAEPLLHRRLRALYEELGELPEAMPGVPGAAVHRAAAEPDSRLADAHAGGQVMSASIKLPPAAKYELRWNGGHATALAAAEAVEIGLAHDSGIGTSVSAVRLDHKLGGWLGRHAGWIVNGRLVKE
jgi:hypothetical protein